MPAYDYVVLDAKGRQKKGVVEGDSARQIRQQLRDKGWVPLQVDITSQKESDSQFKGVLRTSISARDLALITRQLATLVSAGLPLEEALKAVSRQAEKPKLKSMVLAVRARVVEGYGLAQALADYPSAFPELYRATVSAGEQSGHLDLVLEQLADYTEKRQETRNRIQLALLYPVILVFVSIAIVLGLMTYVVPQIVTVFEDMGQELPLLTRALIAISEWVQAAWLYGLLLVAAAGAGFWYGMQKRAFRYRVHALLLKVPLVSRITLGLNSARFASTLAILATSGVPLVEALKIAGQVTSNLCVREAVEDAAVKMSEGESLNQALEPSGYFPPMMIQMIASGESSGELETMLERTASSQQRDLEMLVSTILGLFEPLVLLFMGGVVLIIVLAILLPIMNINQLV